MSACLCLDLVKCQAHTPFGNVPGMSGTMDLCLQIIVCNDIHFGPVVCFIKQDNKGFVVVYDGTITCSCTFQAVNLLYLTCCAIHYCKGCFVFTVFRNGRAHIYIAMMVGRVEIIMGRCFKIYFLHEFLPDGYVP